MKVVFLVYFDWSVVNLFSNFQVSKGESFVEDTLCFGVVEMKFV